MKLSRREMLAVTASAAAAVLLPNSGLAAEPTGFTLPPLPYPVDALEPHIDAKTMEIHHDKHHKAYVDNLNKALAGTEWAGKSIEEVLKAIPAMPDETKVAVINNGGGHYNHSLFWTILGKGGGKPSEDFLKAWGGTLDNLKQAVNEVGVKHFGSGWAWVVYDRAAKQMKIWATQNQDCPLIGDEVPVFGLDVWEHAYYLKYQNRRKDYLEAIWNVLNWDTINRRFADLVKG
ncbi:MAG: superoxide dismutase [Gemmataceae bacterium]